MRGSELCPNIFTAPERVGLNILILSDPKAYRLKPSMARAPGLSQGGSGTRRPRLCDTVVLLSASHSVSLGSDFKPGLYRVLVPQLPSREARSELSEPVSSAAKWGQVQSHMAGLL